MSSVDWRIRFNREIQNALKARYQGNEGRARVCARRAAGIAAEEYLIRGELIKSNQSAYENLRMLQSNQSFSPQILEIIDHFLIRVNSEHQLPKDIDLIREAVWLKNVLIEK